MILMRETTKIKITHITVTLTIRPLPYINVHCIYNAEYVEYVYMEYDVNNVDGLPDSQ